MMEAQFRYLTGAVQHMRRTGTATLEVRRDVQASFNDEMQRRLDKTVWSVGGCKSWYLDPRNGRNTTLWPGSTLEYRRRLRRFDPASYISETVREREPALVD
jgi:hypothetical protein